MEGKVGSEVKERQESLKKLRESIWAEVCDNVIFLVSFCDMNMYNQRRCHGCIHSSLASALLGE